MMERQMVVRKSRFFCVLLLLLFVSDCAMDYNGGVQLRKEGRESVSECSRLPDGDFFLFLEKKARVETNLASGRIEIGCLCFNNIAA
jgi:hypothetical protein